MAWEVVIADDVVVETRLVHCCWVWSRRSTRWMWIDNADHGGDEVVALPCNLLRDQPSCSRDSRALRRGISGSCSNAPLLSDSLFCLVPHFFFAPLFTSAAIKSVCLFLSSSRLSPSSFISADVVTSALGHSDGFYRPHRFSLCYISEGMQINIFRPPISSDQYRRNESAHPPPPPHLSQRSHIRFLGRCPAALRPQFYANVLLTGGNCAIPNLRERLYRDLRASAPIHCEVNVILPEEPMYHAWRGRFSRYSWLLFLRVLLLVSVMTAIVFWRKHDALSGAVYDS